MKNKTFIRNCCLLLLLVMVLPSIFTACKSTSKTTATNSKTTSTNSLVSIMVESPLSLNLGLGYSLLLNVLGTYSDGSTSDITAQVQWTSSDPTVANILSNGAVTGISVGTTNITASLSGITSPAISLTIYVETRTPVTP